MRSILVVTDLSASEMDVAVARAVHLARTHDATLKLMYLPFGRTPPRAGAQLELSRAARQLRKDQQLRTQAAECLGGDVQDVAREAAGCELVVFPNRRERSLRSWLFGQPVQRLLKTCEQPVLLARTVPKGHYTKILVGVDFTERSGALLQFAAMLDPLAGLEVFHAIDTRGEAYLKDAAVNEQAINAYRASRFLGAQENVVRLKDSFGARRNRVDTALRRGDAGRQIVIQQEHSRADLVVVGGDRATPVIPLFAGGVAHRVMSWGSSDVMVLPRKWPSPAGVGWPGSGPAHRGRVLAVGESPDAPI